jgi:cell division protease FtsH
LGIAALLGGISGTLAAPERSYSDFLAAVDSGNVAEVTIDNNLVTWRLLDGTSYESWRPHHPELVERLRDRDVDIRVVPEHSNPILGIFLSWLPMLLLLGVLFYLARRVRDAAGRRDWLHANQELAGKLDQMNAHLAQIETLLASSGDRSPAGKGQ